MTYLCNALNRVLFFIFLLCSSLVDAQTLKGDAGPFSYSLGKNRRDTVWVITGKKPLESYFKKWKFDFVLDARQTIISGQRARMGGLRIGMEYRRVHRFGFGFYGTESDGVFVNSLDEINAEISSARLRLNYRSIFYERVLFFNKKWEWSATAHLGSGTITGDYKIRGSETVRSFPERRVSPFEISTTGYYNITWWCSVGSGVGYRFLRNAPEEVQPVYNAPVAIVRLRIKFGKLIKSIWNDDIKHTY